MAPRALEDLQHDHRHMTRLLDMLGRQIDLVAGMREADTELLFEIADYFRSFPDVYHHPREDLIVRQLVVRVPAAAEELASLEAEHEKGSHDLIRFCHALVNFSMEPDTGRKKFLESARTFLENERRHLAWEEERFFPTAEITLTSDDWAVIDRKIAMLAIPSFERDSRARFTRLGRGLRNWRGAV